MKSWLVIALFSICAIQPIQKGQSAQNAQKNAQPSQKTTPPFSVPNNDHQPISNRDHTSTSKTNNWKDAFAPLTWATWALVLVGSGATIAALCTLGAIRRQARSMRYQTTHLKNSVIQAKKAAKATRNSAEAALLGAKAVINSERAWILMDNLGGPLQSPQNTFYRYPIVLRNFGKTPAKIIAIKIEIQMGNTDSNPSNGSIYDDPQVIVPEIIP